jgi:hypothetical protein
MDPFWLSAFLDFAPDDAGRGVSFWRDVTSYDVSPTRGAHDEFATLVPRVGDDHLRVQRLGEGPTRIHLDVHVTDPRAAADRAVARGAVEVADLGHVVLTSPGGLTFCFVPHPGAALPEPAVWGEGHHAMVYQVCIDVPSARHEAVRAFWLATLDATLEGFEEPEFSWLRPRRQLALDVLVQRLDDEDGEVRAHLDLGTDDRAAEVARHEALGASATAVHSFWTVMRDPVGMTYCITDRDPATRRLPD